MEVARAIAASVENIKHYFDELEWKVNKDSLTDLQYDEKGIILNNSNVLSGNAASPLLTQGNQLPSL